MALPSTIGQSGWSTLTYIPVEVLEFVISYLPNRDIKSLRLTCRTMSERARLRIKRVFLSPNPRNIEVLRAIAGHEMYRRYIIEIIWDDVQLVDKIEPTRNWSHLALGHWFTEICEWNIQERVVRRNEEPNLSIKESWEYYQQLVQQQKDVIASGADIEAFNYALKRFPALKRIIITPAAHGILDKPLYETPMIRAFPPGFNYPILHDDIRCQWFDYSNLPIWPLPDHTGVPPYLLPWDEQERLRWRGFCIIIRELAKRSDHRVSELIIEPHGLETGLNCRIFDKPCEEYNNLITLFRRPGFTRIDLCLAGYGQYNEDQEWSSFRSGYLKRALSQTSSDLTHFSLRTQIDYERIQELDVHWTMQFTRYWIPLQTFLPIEKWPKLRHFGLSGFLVRVDNLLSVLKALPRTLRSVELSALKFTGEWDCWYGLFEDMRETLAWHERPIDERPLLKVRVPRPGGYGWSCLDREAAEFFYGQGENPFSPYFGGDLVEIGKGIIRGPFPLYVETETVE